MALYTLRLSYGGDARRQIKTYGPWRGTFNGNNCERGTHRSLPIGTDPATPSKLGWILWYKGRFLCRLSHRAKIHQPRAELTAAINKRNPKLPSALVTVSDMAFVVDMRITEESTPDKSDGILAQWAEECDATSESSMAFISEADFVDVGQHLATSSFVHGRTLPTTRSIALISMHSRLSNGSIDRLLFAQLNTCANRRSIMSKKQYTSYCDDFGLRSDIRSGKRATIEGIGRK